MTDKSFWLPKIPSFYGFLIVPFHFLAGLYPEDSWNYWRTNILLTILYISAERCAGRVLVPLLRPWCRAAPVRGCALGADLPVRTAVLDCGCHLGRRSWTGGDFH